MHKRTATISAYQPWGARHFYAAVMYRGKLIKGFEHKILNLAVADARNFAHGYGFTHCKVVLS